MKRYSFVFVLLIVVLGWAGRPALAQGDGWSKPFKVSNEKLTPSSWFPDIAAAPDDSIFIVWSSGLNGKIPGKDGTDLLMYRELRNGHWSEINNVFYRSGGGMTVRNSIALGPDRRLHVLARRHTDVVYLSAPEQNSWSVQNWDQPKRIAAGTTYFNEITVDHKNVLQAFWNDAVRDDPEHPNTKCNNCADIFYRRSTDFGATWSAPVNISRTEEGSVKPQAKVADDDTVHVVWEEGFDWYSAGPKRGDPTAAMYRRSRDGGITWDPPVVFTLPLVKPKPPEGQPGTLQEPQPAPIPDAPRQITLSLYQNTNPVVVYRSAVTDSVYFQFSKDGGSTWTRPAVIPGIQARDIHQTDHDDYAMATDGAGNVHLVLSGHLPGADFNAVPDLLHVVWNGSTWSAPKIIATSQNYPGWVPAVASRCLNIIQPTNAAERDALDACYAQEQLPEWPKIAIGSGDQLHVTWFTRSRLTLFTSDEGHYQVWYASKLLPGVPKIAAPPLILPLLTAVAPTAATPAPIPTPTLAPNIVDAPTVEHGLAWEGPGILTLVIAILPAIGLLGLIIGVRVFMTRQRRRVDGRSHWKM